MLEILDIFSLVWVLMYLQSKSAFNKWLYILNWSKWILVAYILTQILLTLWLPLPYQFCEKHQFVILDGYRCNRQGQCAPQRLLTGKFLLTCREKRGKEKMDKGVKWRSKGKVENWNGRREKCQNEKRTFFFLNLFVCLLFFFAFHLWKRPKFVLGLPKFLPGKSISRREKNQEKLLCPPQKKIPVTSLDNNSQ